MTNSIKVGDIIYVPATDDHTGGQATISEIFLEQRKSHGSYVTFIKIEEHAGTWNWEEYLGVKQKEFQDQYQDMVVFDPTLHGEILNMLDNMSEIGRKDLLNKIKVRYG